VKTVKSRIETPPIKLCHRGFRVIGDRLGIGFGCHLANVLTNYANAEEAVYSSLEGVSWSDKNL
jgi:hypothetical protein